MATPRRLLLIGADTPLGLELAGICGRRRLAVARIDARALHELDTVTFSRRVAEVEPWALVDTTGSSRVRVRLTVLGARVDLPLLVISPRMRGPFEPADGPGYAPLVVRGSDLFGGHFGRTPVDRFLEAALAGLSLDADPDHFLVPTYLPDLVDVALDLLIDGGSGNWQLSHGLAVSLGDLAGNIHRLLANGGVISGVRIQGPDLHPLLRPLEEALRCWAEEGQHAEPAEPVGRENTPPELPIAARSQFQPS